MPFKDTKEGQTHYYGDNCGEPEHNDMQHLTEKEIREKLEKAPVLHLSQLNLAFHPDELWVLKSEMVEFVLSIRSQELQELMEKVKDIPIGWVEINENEYDTQADAFIDGANLMQVKVLAILQASMSKE